MIQNFTNALSCVLKYKYIIILMGFGVIALTYIFLQFHLETKEDIHQILNGLFQFSGIFSAILITFIISKVIQFRQEKLERKKEIIQLSNKVTDFRRIARILIDSQNFWKEGLKFKMDSTFRELTFFHIKLWDYNNEEKYPSNIASLREQFLDATNISGGYLYLDLKSLLLKDFTEFDLFGHYDYDYSYPIEILEPWIIAPSGNNLWYCLEHDWNHYKEHIFPKALSPYNQQQILSLCKKINPDKYINTQYESELLASIGTDFTTYILPKLYDLISLNEQGLPKYVSLLISLLYVIMITGVLLPLIMISLKVNFTLLLIISSLGVGVLGLSLVLFLLQFKNILENEIRIDK